MKAQRTGKGAFRNFQFIGDPLTIFQSWRFIGELFAVSILLGYKAFSTTSGVPLADSRTALDNLYLAVQLYVLNSGAVARVNWWMELARFLAPAVLGWATVVAVARVLRQKLFTWRLHFYHRHTIICGLGEKGSQLLADRISGGRKACRRREVVIIERDQENLHVKAALERGFIVLVGDATDPDLLRRARVSHAEVVYAVTGSDLTNLQIALQARTIPAWPGARSDRSDARVCYTHLREERGYHMLADVNKEPAVDPQPMEAVEFDIYRTGIRRILDEITVTISAQSIKGKGDNATLIGVLDTELDALKKGESTRGQVLGTQSGSEQQAVLVFGKEHSALGAVAADDAIIATALKIREEPQEKKIPTIVYACIWQEPRGVGASSDLRVRRVTGTSVEDVELDGIRSISFEGKQTPTVIKRRIELGLRSHQDGVREVAVETLNEWLRSGTQHEGAAEVVRNSQTEVLNYLDILSLRGMARLFSEDIREMVFRANTLIGMLLQVHGSHSDPKLIDDFGRDVVKGLTDRVGKVNASVRFPLRSVINVLVASFLRRLYREKGATACQYIEMLYALKHHKEDIDDIGDLFLKSFDEVEFTRIQRLAQVHNGLTSWLVYSYLASWLADRFKRSTPTQQEELLDTLKKELTPGEAPDDNPTLRYVIQKSLKTLLNLDLLKEAQLRQRVSDILKSAVERDFAKHEWHLTYVRPHEAGAPWNPAALRIRPSDCPINESDCRDDFAVHQYVGFRYLGLSRSTRSRRYWIKPDTQTTRYEYDNHLLTDYVVTFGKAYPQDVVTLFTNVAKTEETVEGLAYMLGAFSNSLNRLDKASRPALLLGMVKMFQDLPDGRCEQELVYQGKTTKLSQVMTDCLGRLRVANRVAVDAVLRNALPPTNLARIVADIRKWEGKEAAENTVSPAGDMIYQKTLANETARKAFAAGIKRSATVSTVWKLFYAYVDEVQKALAAPAQRTH